MLLEVVLVVLLVPGIRGFVLDFSVVENLSGSSCGVFSVVVIQKKFVYRGDFCC